jgi:hypothetical protein
MAADILGAATAAVVMVVLGAVTVRAQAHHVVATVEVATARIVDVVRRAGIGIHVAPYHVAVTRVGVPHPPRSALVACLLVDAAGIAAVAAGRGAATRALRRDIRQPVVVAVASRFSRVAGVAGIARATGTSRSGAGSR